MAHIGKKSRFQAAGFFCFLFGCQQFGDVQCRTCLLYTSVASPILRVELYVPHDVKGLARLMGGKKPFVDKLQRDVYKRQGICIAGYGRPGKHRSLEELRYHVLRAEGCCID